MLYKGVRVKARIKVVSADKQQPKELVLADDRDYIIQPPPHCYDHPVILRIMTEAMMKLQYIYELPEQITKDLIYYSRLHQQEWMVEAEILEYQPILA